jgi:hypothetical protein
VDDLLLAGSIQEDCMEETHLFHERQDTKFLRKKAQIFQDTINPSAFTCPKGNTGTAPRGNKLSIPIQPPRPTRKSEFWELQVSAKSGSLTTPTWPNPSMKPQKGENRNL